jgi:hypothetical protein
VPPLPTGRFLELLIIQCRDTLSEEERADHSFDSDSELWLELLALEWWAVVDSYDCPYPLGQKNRKGRHQW